MSTKSRAPKRRIERIRSKGFNINVPITETEQILHTCEDAKTLIRILGVVHGRHDDLRWIECAIVVKPAGALVVGVDRIDALDVDVPTQLIASRVFFFGVTTKSIETWEFDIKAMRKLKQGDVVSLRYITATDAGSITFDIHTWYKE